jgi:hypothetical protein
MRVRVGSYWPPASCACMNANQQDKCNADNGGIGLATIPMCMMRVRVGSYSPPASWAYISEMSKTSVRWVDTGLATTLLR